MDLNELRRQIDLIDNDILEKFQKRMDLCLEVAEYKKKNNVGILQSSREQDIINRVTALSEDRYKDSAAVLFSNIMDISKNYQQNEINKGKNFIDKAPLEISGNSKVGCYGVTGSNSEEATRMFFGNEKEISFFSEFEDIFRAVDEGRIDFGVVPLQNSSTGSITQTYDLMRKYNVYINKMIRVSIKHCLAAKNTDKISEIDGVYSHPQAIMQCSEFISKNNLSAIEYASTATSAEFVSKSDKKIAAICSESCAELYGLEVLARDISNDAENFTRFICISKNFAVEQGADIISLQLAIPNEKGSLYKLLTKFSVSGLNLLKLESRPRHEGNFDVVFYLDFEGTISDERINALLIQLEKETTDFKFLGNYSELQ
ncbi:MAG: chorismate mutase [Oscillospiraceae bacterium]